MKQQFLIIQSLLVCLVLADLSSATAVIKVPHRPARTVRKDIAGRTQSASAVAPQDMQNNYNATSGNGSKSPVKVVCLILIAFSSAGLFMWLLATFFCTGDTKDEQQSIDDLNERSSWYSDEWWTTGHHRQETLRSATHGSSNRGDQDKDDHDLEAAISETNITKEHILQVSNIAQKQSTHTHTTSRQEEGQVDKLFELSTKLFNVERKPARQRQDTPDSPFTQPVHPVLHEKWQHEKEKKQKDNDNQLPRAPISSQNESMPLTPIMFKNSAEKPHTARGTFIYLEGPTRQKEIAQTNDVRDTGSTISSSSSSSDDSLALNKWETPWPVDSDQGKVRATRGVAFKEKSEDKPVSGAHSSLPRNTDLPLGSLATTTTCYQEKDDNALPWSSKELTYIVSRVQEHLKETAAAGNDISYRVQKHPTENSKTIPLETRHGSDDEPVQTVKNLKDVASLSRELIKKPIDLKKGTENKGDNYTPFVRRRGPLIVGQHVENKDVCWVAALKGSRIYIAVAMVTLGDLSRVALPRHILHTRFKTTNMSILTGHFDTDLETTIKTPNCYQYKNNDPVDYISSFVRDLREKVGLDRSGDSTKPLKSSPLIICRMCISLLIGRIKAEFSDSGMSEKTCVLSPAVFNKKSSYYSGYMRDIREAARVLFKEEQFEALGEQPSLSSETNEHRNDKDQSHPLEWDGFEWREESRIKSDTPRESSA